VNLELQNHPAIDFLSVQRDFAHKLVKSVTADVEALGANSDSAMLPARLRAVSAALSKNAVPGEWQCDFLDIDSVSEWLEQLFARTAALDALAVRVRDHSVLTSQPVPLFATMKPRAFVSALMQTAVRMNKVELDQLRLVTTFAGPAAGALITLNVCDLALQAGVAKGNAVAPSQTPNDDLCRLDKVFLNVCQGGADKAVALPVFESVERDRFVAEVQVAAESADQVVLASTAFVSSA